MTWLPHQTLADFAIVARLAGVSLAADDIRIEALYPPNGRPAPEDALQRTVCWEETMTENHEFSVDRDSLPEAVTETHVSLFDGTNCGIAVEGKPIFSVQHHPEASPGPTDAHYLFTAFARLMAGEPDYLSIDIAADRLAGWNFGSDVQDK